MKSLPFIAADVDAYIAAFPEPTRKKLQDIRRTIRKAAPAAVEKISYGIPMFELKGKLAHFAAYKSHIGFHAGAAAVANFRERLSSYRSSIGTVQFPLDRPIPLELVDEIIRFKVRVNLESDRMK